MYKTAGRKEKCDVDRQIACGYFCSKTMHFGQKVMEDVQKHLKCHEDVQNSLKMAGSRCKSSLKWLKYKATRKIDLTTLSTQLTSKICPFEISHRSQEAHKFKGRNLGSGPKSGALAQNRASQK